MNNTTMDKTELMIGDWVMCKRPLREPTTERVGDLGLCTMTIANVQEHDPRIITYGYDKLLPIPLTRDILEKNGFHHDSDDYYRLWVDDYRLFIEIGGLVFVSIGHKINTYPKVSVNIKYVHEFQHALRMVGLRRLADDFMV